jgi:hypothetical protein
MPIEMHYSWIGFVYQATAWLGQRLAEKWFYVVLALLGTLFGYWLAKLHLEHFVSGIVNKMDAKYLDLNRQMAFHRAVNAMLPELPQFYLRPSKAFSPKVAGALGWFCEGWDGVDLVPCPGILPPSKLSPFPRSTGPISKSSRRKTLISKRQTAFWCNPVAAVATYFCSLFLHYRSTRLN